MIYLNKLTHFTMLVKRLLPGIKEIFKISLTAGIAYYIFSLMVNTEYYANLTVKKAFLDFFVKGVTSVNLGFIIFFGVFTVLLICYGCFRVIVTVFEKINRKDPKEVRTIKEISKISLVFSIVYYAGDLVVNTGYYANLTVKKVFLDLFVKESTPINFGFIVFFGVFFILWFFWSYWIAFPKFLKKLKEKTKIQATKEILKILFLLSIVYYAGDLVINTEYYANLTVKKAFLDFFVRGVTPINHIFIILFWFIAVPLIYHGLRIALSKILEKNITFKGKH